MSVATKDRRPNAVISGRRLDAAGRWHDVASTPCDECGCPWDYSIDEPGLVWEPGPRIEDECSDPECDCHVAPIMGMRFLVRAA